MTIWEKLKNILVVLGFLVAVASIIVSVLITYGPLERIDNNMSEMTDSLKSVRITAEIGNIVAYTINEESWSSYAILAKHEASQTANSDCFVRLNSDGIYYLTDTGDLLINHGFREAIVEARKVNKDISDRDLVLQIGIRPFVEEALRNNITPSAMIGTVIVFLQ